MDAEDTTTYLKTNGFDGVNILPNQIQRRTKIMEINDDLHRITVWVALNTKLLQHIIHGLEYRIKNVIFLYHAHKPLTLLRAKGWWECFKRMQIKNCTMCLVSTKSEYEETKPFEKIISHISNKFLTEHQVSIPHYALDIRKLIKNIF